MANKKKRSISTIRSEVVETRLGNEKVMKRQKMAELYLEEQVDDHVVLYESFAGRGMICNPYAIFRMFMQRPDFSDYVHVWALDDYASNRKIMEEYKGMENVRFVKHDSHKYMHYLSTAKYLITNVSFPSYYIKKDEQVLINTWHGIPLKTLGYDIAGGIFSTFNTVRNMLSSNYLISPSDFFTEVYRDAYRLEGIFAGKVIQEGMPRNDLLYHTDREYIVEKLRRNGVKVEDGKKIILYAPTWKGEKYSEPDQSLDVYLEFISYIENHVDTNEYQVLVKPHQIVYKYIKDNKDVTNQFVPGVIDANELLSITDILVSDYSSIFFDYLVTERPILFYIPDIEEYKSSRGLYIDVDELPGPSTKSIADIANYINDIENATVAYKEQYEQKKQWAAAKDDGNVCKRVIDVMLGNQNGNLISFENGKKKVLVYAGNFTKGSWTDSVLERLNSMNFDAYDVTVMLLQKPDDEDAVERIQTLDSRIRIMCRNKYTVLTTDEAVNHAIIKEWGIENKKYGKLLPVGYYQREIKRVFGNTKFDYAVNYVPNHLLFSLLFAYVPNAKTQTWLYEDIGRRFDWDKEQAKFKSGTPTVVSLLGEYDEIVALTPKIMDMNKYKYANFLEKRKYCVENERKYVK